MTFVVDSSAVLALMFREDGAQFVSERLPGALLSCVNLAEIIGRLSDRGVSIAEAKRLTDKLELSVVAFDEALAVDTAALLAKGREHGLSLGDRACVALAQREGLPVLTGDREWASAELGVDVVLIR